MYRTAAGSGILFLPLPAPDSHIGCTAIHSTSGRSQPASGGSAQAGSHTQYGCSWSSNNISPNSAADRRRNEPAAPSAHRRHPRCPPGEAWSTTAPGRAHVPNLGVQQLRPRHATPFPPDRHEIEKPTRDRHEIEKPTPQLRSCRHPLDLSHRPQQIRACLIDVSWAGSR